MVNSLHEEKSPPEGKPLFWTNFIEAARAMHRKPSQNLVEAKILSWILLSSIHSQTAEEAVKAISGADFSDEAIRGCVDSGVLEVLCLRLKQCTKISNGLAIQRQGLDRIEAYLYAIHQLVQLEIDPSPSFRSLIEPGGVLHRWDDFEPCLQALAFSVRMHILILCGIDDHENEWSRTKSSLETLGNSGMHYGIRTILIGAIMRGMTRGMPKTGKICGLLIAHQVGICE